MCPKVLTNFCGFDVLVMPPSPQDEIFRKYPSRTIYWSSDRNASGNRTLVFTRIGVEDTRFAELQVRALLSEEGAEPAGEMVQQLLSQVRSYYQHNETLP